MNGVRILAWIVIAIMTANMANVMLHSGMDHGVGFDTFLAGSKDPWQLFINNDLVTGLLFTVGWIIFRERGGRTVDTVAWVWMALWWGNIVIATYVLWAARQAQGDWTIFFLGRRTGAIADYAPGQLLRLLCLAGAVAVTLYVGRQIFLLGYAAIPTFGYVAGFAPILLSLLLVGTRRVAGASTAN